MTSSSSSPSSSPRVTVIIPVKDDADRLDLCLDALGKQTFTDPFEVIVGDNGSSDNIEEVIAKYPFARMVREPEHGSYAARNAAVALSQGEIFAFTDADCIPSETWIENAVKRIEEVGPDAFIGGRIPLFPVDANRPTPGEAYVLCHGFPQQRSVEQQKWSATANMITTRHAFEKAGPFAQTFISSGDREWGNRATERGITGYYFDDVQVRHPARATFAELRKKNIRMIKGDLQMREAQNMPLITTRELAIAIAPPIPTLRRMLPKVDPPTLTTKLKYVTALFYLTYARLFDRLRLIRETRSSGPASQTAPRDAGMSGDAT